MKFTEFLDLFIFSIVLKFKRNQIKIVKMVLHMKKTIFLQYWKKKNELSKIMAIFGFSVPKLP